MQSHATTCSTTPASAVPSPLPRLYLRPDEAAEVIGVSRRTLSAWQAARVISYRRVGRTVLFSVADIQRALDRFIVAAIGEPRPRKAAETGTITIQPSKRTRRMEFIKMESLPG